MKRLALALIVWLALALPCAASTYIANTSSQAAGSGNANNAVPVPAGTTNGDTLVFCHKLDSTTVTTLGGTFTSCTNFASLVDTTSGGLDMKCGCRVASSEPASYTPTWTGNSASIGEMIDLKSTDSSTPLIDVTPVGNAGSTIAAVTTATNDDLVIVPILDNTGNSGKIDSGQQPFGTALNVQHAHVLYAGQKTAGSTSAWSGPSLTFNGAGTVLAITIAVKSNTTTAASFVGVGAETNNAGSAAFVAPPAPPNGSATDIALAGLTESTTGVTITPNPVINGFRGCAYDTSAATNHTVNKPTGVVNNDQMLTYLITCTTPTTLSGWTLVIDDHANCEMAYKKTASSEGSSYTWAGTSTIYLAQVCSFFDPSGGTLNVGNSGSLTSGTSTTSFTSYRVTTAHNNAIVYNPWNQSSGSGRITPPTSTEQTGFSDATNVFSAGVFGQVTAGLSATQVANSTASAGWRTMQIEVYASASPFGATSTWAHVPVTSPVVNPVTDPGNTAQLDLYQLLPPILLTNGLPLYFYFGSNPATSDSAVTEWGNLDTTTPVEACASLGASGMANPMAPSMTPTSADELLFYANAPSVTFGTPTLLGSSANNRLAMGYGPLSQSAANSSGGSNTNPFVTLKCALKAATTPTRTTAHALTNFEAYEVFTSTLPVVTSNGGWFF